MSKPAKDGVRKRTNAAQSNGGDGDKASTSVKTSSPAPSAAGMTCFNWIMVLFFIFLVGGGTAFFIHQEMTITNRALMREVKTLKQESSSVTEFSEKIKEMIKIVEIVQGMQRDVADIKDQQRKNMNELTSIKATLQSEQEVSEDLKNRVEASTTLVRDLKGQLETVKLEQPSATNTDELESSVKRMEDLIKVSNTNVAYLSDEVLRLEKSSKEQHNQVYSIQSEVINLTADKSELFGAMESVKSTIVGVREKVDLLVKERAQSEEFLAVKFKDLETKTDGEFARYSREMTEMKDNSAQWLQESTDELTKKVNDVVGGLAGQLQEIKGQIQEPTSASETQSIINSIASLDIKLQNLGTEVLEMGEIVKDLGQTGSDASPGKELEAGVKQDIGVLKSYVKAMRTTGDEMAVKLDSVSKQVTTVENEIRGIRTAAAILETRVEDVRGQNQKFDDALKKLQSTSGQE